jgi:hypothetical protein
MENKELTIADLTMLKFIVELSSTRGAFKAAELKEVGEVYNKLSAFLEVVVAQAKVQDESATKHTQGE